MEKDLLRLLQVCVGLLVALTTCLAYVSLFPHADSSTAAGWASAIIAALVAIGVAYDQHKKARAKELQQERQNAIRMLQSLHDEIKVMVDGFVNGVGRYIDAVQDGDYLDGELRITESRFGLYKAFIKDLALLSDERLRHKIIEVHTSYEVFILALGFHSDFIAALTVARERNREQPSRHRRSDVSQARQAVVNNFSAVRSRYLLAKEGTMELLGMLAAAVGRIECAHRSDEKSE